LIEELIATSTARHCVTYFYCALNENEKERSDPEEILRCIVRQMAIIPPPEESALYPASDIYRSRDEKKIPLSLDESIGLIVELTTYYPLTYIVIDALDECDQAKRLKLVEGLSRIIKDSHNPVKVFVSSRDDKDIFLRLKDLPNFYIKASDNAGDIYRYILTEVNGAIADKRLLHGNISPELTQKIIETLTTRAQGM